MLRPLFFLSNVMAIGMIVFHVCGVFSSWPLLTVFGVLSLVLAILAMLLLWVLRRALSRLYHRKAVGNPLDWIDINDPADPTVSGYFLAFATSFILLSIVTGHWRW